MRSADETVQTFDSEAIAIRGLRILATSQYPHWASSGGTDHVVWKVMSRAARWGARATIVTGLPLRSRGKPLHSTLDGVEIIAVPAYDLGRYLRVELSVAPTAGRELRTRTRAGGFDVVYANGLYFPITVQASAAARRAGVPLVLGAHVGRIRGLSRPVRAATALYETTVVRRAVQRAQAVIAVADNVADEVHRLVPSAAVHVVKNGVDLVSAPAAQRSTTSPETQVIFVGRLIANKGPHLLLEAVHQLRSGGVALSLLFVGDGPLRPELERRVRELRLGDRVRFAGHVRDVTGALAEADIFARPSGSEGLSLAILEAMAAGVCAVASDIPGNRELIVDGVNGCLVPLGDVDQLAITLRRLARNSGLRLRLADRARQTAASFSWEHAARETLTVLGDVARTGPSR